MSILQQTIAGLAVAEEVYQFEHRDLHWGNILVEPSKGKKFVEFTLAGVTKQIKCVDVTSRIIDFTFSRMTKGISYIKGRQRFLSSVPICKKNQRQNMR